MKTHGVYCKGDLSSPPIELLTGTEEECKNNIRRTAEEYSAMPNFKTELIEEPAFQLLVTDLGGKSVFTTKYFFVAPVEFQNDILAHRYSIKR